MKKLVMAVLMLLVGLMLTGCGKSPTSPINGEPDPYHGKWGVTFYPVYTDASSTAGIKLRVTVDGEVIQSLPVEQGGASNPDSVTVIALERDVNYDISFLDMEGKVIQLKLGTELKSFFTLRLADGVNVEEVEVPAFELQAKVVIPTTGSLLFYSTPGASVFLDGQNKGMVQTDGTLLLEGLEPKVYAVEVNKQGCENWTGQVVVKVGETARVDAPLVQKKSVFEGFVNG
ncbi:PEGA domain-containing protein, partial [Candidatus Parcubacteria bacterium]|nr:PEGA domain-containing protein [Candidatus Parcubacteria bacterium]